jgi:predicted dithiol-disulfide oxidoreductase (DUF899 family)
VKSETDDVVDQLELQIAALAEQVSRLRRQRPMESVADYALHTADGEEVRLSALFGKYEEMILVHNMGTECSYCTMWADGFNGLLPHLEDRAAFVVVSPDEPSVQKRFAGERGWRFRMVSAAGTSLFADLGFDTAGGLMPGVSTLERRGGEMKRRSRAEFGPGDRFCAVWHLLDLLPRGRNGWEPRLDYRATTQAHHCSRGA